MGLKEVTEKPLGQLLLYLPLGHWEFLQHYKSMHKRRAEVWSEGGTAACCGLLLFFLIWLCRDT